MRKTFAKVVYAQAGLGMAAYCLADVQAGLALLGPVLCLASWFLVESESGKPLPRLIINSVVVFATAWLFFTQLSGGGQLISGLGYYILFLQLCKLFEKKNGRDWAQLIILSLMQMVCAAILSNQFMFAMLLVIYLPLAVTSALMYQLVQGGEAAARSAEKQMGLFTEDPKWLEWSAQSKRPFMGLMLGLGLVALAGSTVLFAVLPRGRAAGALNRFSRSGVASVGYASKVQLTGNQTLSQNNEPVMHVALSRLGNPVGGSGHFFRLRGMALDHYNPVQGAWVRKGSVFEDRRLVGRGPVTLADPLPDVAAVRQEITLLVSMEDNLFSLHPPLRVYIPGRASWNSHDQVIRYLDSKPLQEKYWVESLDSNVGNDLWDAYQRLAPSARGFQFSKYARGPVLTGSAGERLKSLADQILQPTGLSRPLGAFESDQDYAIASAIERHLQKNYRYTLSLPPLPKDIDPIEAFLFETRAGHCQYFASSLCALLRSIGMRARVVTGFHVTEYNDVGGYHVVRQRNAHAWAEVWGPQGWRTFDPSPPADIEALHRPRDDFWSTASRWYDYLEYQWVNHVITFDKTQQGGLAQSIQAAWARLGAWFKQLIMNGGLANPVVLVGLAGLIGLFSMLIRTRRKWEGLLPSKGLSRRRREALRRQIDFYARALVWVRRAGHQRESDQTPEAFAQSLIQMDAGRYAAMGPLTDLYYQIRYGGRTLDAQARAEADRLLGQLKHPN